jgi:hypothetical protein
MATQSPGPTFSVHVDEQGLAEIFAHPSEAGRAAIAPVIQDLRTEGASREWLKQCDAEARDGTRLSGCVKLNIPQPAGQWGAVLLGGIADGKPTLFLLAVGERHPGASWRPSVYEVAHRRLQSRG